MTIRSIILNSLWHNTVGLFVTEGQLCLFLTCGYVVLSGDLICLLAFIFSKGCKGCKILIQIFKITNLVTGSFFGSCCFVYTFISFCVKIKTCLKCFSYMLFCPSLYYLWKCTKIDPIKCIWTLFHIYMCPFNSLKTAMEMLCQCKHWYFVTCYIISFSIFKCFKYLKSVQTKLKG